jgi:hypothetical protein
VNERTQQPLAAAPIHAHSLDEFRVVLDLDFHNPMVDAIVVRIDDVAPSMYLLDRLSFVFATLQDVVDCEAVGFIDRVLVIVEHDPKVILCLDASFC